MNIEERVERLEELVQHLLAYYRTIQLAAAEALEEMNKHKD